MTDYYNRGLESDIDRKGRWVLESKIGLTRVTTNTSESCDWQTFEEMTESDEENKKFTEP